MEGQASASYKQHVTGTSLEDLWAWACLEASALHREAPHRLHSQSGDRDDQDLDPSVSFGDVIGGLPFTRAFASYLDGVLPPAPVVKALWRMRYSPADSRLQRDMFKIALGVLQGETSREALRQRLRLTEFAFATAALHGLSALRAKTEYEYRAERPAA